MLNRVTWMVKIGLTVDFEQQNSGPNVLPSGQNDRGASDMPSKLKSSTYREMEKLFPIYMTTYVDNKTCYNV